MNTGLEGKVLTNVTKSADGETIAFHSNSGDIIAHAEGDCCSYSWVEHIELPALGFPCTVLKVENLDMPDLGEQPGHDVMSYYGLKVTTDKGEIIVDYRNDFNGHCGGYLVWPGGSYDY